MSREKAKKDTKEIIETFHKELVMLLKNNERINNFIKSGVSFHEEFSAELAMRALIYGLALNIAERLQDYDDWHKSKPVIQRLKHPRTLEFGLHIQKEMRGFLERIEDEMRGNSMHEATTKKSIDK